MGHFAKHWPAELVEDVEEVIRNRVSKLIFCSSLHLTDFTIRYNLPLQFIERFNRNNQEQPRATRVRKAAATPPKLGRRYIDDSDISSDDSDSIQATSTVNTYMEEWKLYLNTNEVVPDDVGIARWWGVGLAFLFPGSEI